MLTYPWKCTVLHCNHLGNTWKPLVLMTRLLIIARALASVRSSAPVVSKCFPGGYNVKLYISRGGLAWWLLTFLHSVSNTCFPLALIIKVTYIIYNKLTLFFHYIDKAPFIVHVAPWVCQLPVMLICY